jgi:S-adenosylmethionine:tRNA ribosyltransferase-isomerase
VTPVLDSPPIERRGLPRDAARLLVDDGGAEMRDDTMRGLPRHLRAGDLLVVNLSATVPAALEAPGGLLVHLSTPLPDGDWLVELRRRCRMGSVPFGVEPAERVLPLPGGGAAELLGAAARRPGGGVRLWRARLDLPGGVRRYLAGHGRPIRYGCAAGRWPIEDYQTIFATMPGSAEMPSAGRGFTHRLVAELVEAGVGLAPVVLHAGVSSPEAGEPPSPEHYWVPAATARRVNATRARGGRVLAVGTTVVRALETDARSGRARPGRGWTELVVSPARGVSTVDGILTGWHEPEASHLQLLEAVAGPGALARSYAAAHALGHRWHEFGDFNLLLSPSRRADRTGGRPVHRVRERPPEALTPELSAGAASG